MSSTYTALVILSHISFVTDYTLVSSLTATSSR